MGGGSPNRQRSHASLSAADSAGACHRLQHIAGAPAHRPRRQPRLPQHALYAPRRRERAPGLLLLQQPPPEGGRRGGGRGHRSGRVGVGIPEASEDRVRGGGGGLGCADGELGGADGGEAAAASVDPAAAQAIRGRCGAPWDQERGAEDDYAVDER